MTEPLAERLKAALVCCLAVLLSPVAAQAQGAVPDLRQVRWPLVDIVMVPDSGGLWLIAGPNPGTQQWESGSHLVDLRVDPVLALQWVTVARGLTPEEGSAPSREPVRVTPPLREKHGPAFLLLGINPRKKASAKERLVFVVSDSGSSTHWRSFASVADVNVLLGALESVAFASRDGAHAAGWDIPGEEDPDEGVSAVSQPRPVYPSGLATMGRVGRVWMTYVVSAEGRPQRESFVPVLSDDSLFTQAAIEALLRGRYRAAVSNGQPVPLRVFQAILFRQR